MNHLVGYNCRRLLAAAAAGLAWSCSGPTAPTPGRPDQAIQRNLIHVLAAGREVDRRVEVRATMLGGAQRVGFVIPATFGDSLEIALEVEPGSGRPENSRSRG